MQNEKQSFFEKFAGGSSDAPQQQTSTPIYYAEDDDQPMNIQQETTTTAEPEQDQWSADDADGQLTIDVYQTDDHIIIKSTIAGVKPEDLDVSISNDMITIKGERKNEDTIEEDNYYYQECYWGSFARSVVLPTDVVPEKIDATLKNGILTIKLPKADTTKTRKIQVRGF